MFPIKNLARQGLKITVKSFIGTKPQHNTNAQNLNILHGTTQYVSASDLVPTTWLRLIIRGSFY